ncbi:MAG: DUF2256 domain-containing protein [Segetibacter sp.]
MWYVTNNLAGEGKWKKLWKELKYCSDKCRMNKSK